MLRSRSMINIVQMKIEKALTHWEALATNVNISQHRYYLERSVKQALELSPESAVKATLNDCLKVFAQMVKVGRRGLGKLVYNELGTLLQRARVESAGIKAEVDEMEELRKAVGL
jgi:hypothetical protein